MTHDSAPPQRPAPRGAWGASAILISFTVGSATSAQVAPQVEIRGHVSTRCWAWTPSPVHLNMSGERLAFSQEPMVRCSQGRMPLSIEMRAPKPVAVEAAGEDRTGLAVAAAVEKPAQRQPQTAAEIIVSPTP